MNLSREQRREFRDALVDAFPTDEKLKQMVSFQLDEKLQVIAQKGNLEDVAFNLIQWAQSQGR